MKSFAIKIKINLNKRVSLSTTFTLEYVLQPALWPCTPQVKSSEKSWLFKRKLHEFHLATLIENILKRLTI